MLFNIRLNDLSSGYACSVINLLYLLLFLPPCMYPPPLLCVSPLLLSLFSIWDHSPPGAYHTLINSVFLKSYGSVPPRAQFGPIGVPGVGRSPYLTYGPIPLLQPYAYVGMFLMVTATIIACIPLCELFNYCYCCCYCLFLLKPIKTIETKKKDLPVEPHPRVPPHN